MCYSLSGVWSVIISLKRIVSVWRVICCFVVVIIDICTMFLSIACAQLFTCDPQFCGSLMPCTPILTRSFSHFWHFPPSITQIYLFWAACVNSCHDPGTESQHNLPCYVADVSTQVLRNVYPPAAGEIRPGLHPWKQNSLPCSFQPVGERKRHDIKFAIVHTYQFFLKTLCQLTNC